MAARGRCPSAISSRRNLRPSCFRRSTRQTGHQGPVQRVQGPNQHAHSRGRTYVCPRGNRPDQGAFGSGGRCKLALSVVRLEGLQRGRIRGVQDGYHLYLRQQALPYNHDVPSTAYIEEIPVGVVDDDAASRDTQIVRHVRPQRYYTDGAPRAKPRTATARAPGSTAPAVSREPSNQDPQPPSPPSTQHYVPPPVPQPPPRQSHSRAPSVERTMPSMYQPHRKLSAITEASNSNSTPHSANVPTPLAGSTASPLRHHTFDTPVASTSRHTLDNGLPNGGYAYRSHQRPPSPHQSHSTQSPQIEIKPPTPPEHSDPLPAQYPSLSPMQNTRSVPVTPRTTYTQPPTPRSTYAQPQTPRTEYVQPSTPRFNGYSHPQTPRTNYSQPQTPRAPYSQVAGTTNVQPPASFTVPPVPTPNYRQSSATNRPPHVPITIPHGAMRMPDSDDTGTMTPLSESAHLTSFPKVERADKEKDRLSAIPEGGSTVSGSSPLPGVADSIADWRGSTISTDVFTPSTISNANLLHPNMPTQGGLAPPNHLQRRPSTGSRSTHSIEFNIEPPSRPASGDVGDMQQASGFLSPNSAPQALPAEPPSTSQPVIPDTGDYADDSDEDSSDNGSSATGTPSSFVAYVQPPSEPEAAGSQTPKMLPSANWGQSNGGWQQQPQQVPNGYGVLPRDAIGPSRSTSASSGGIATDGRVWPPPSGTASSTHSGKGRSPSGSGSVGQKSPRYETTATPPGFTYPLPPGRMASSKGGKSPKPSRRASMASDSTSTTSSTDDSSDVSSQSGRTAVSAGGSSNWRHGTVANGVVGGNVVSTGPALQTGILNKKTSNGESPPDATTYMNTLANSATGTPRFGRGTPGAMGGSKKLPTGQSPYTGFKSLYA
ncbi:hypothetical protein CYLTODRAFT_135413 [Cylindrobasidium torrendii FP15055 ss-10]|uniref:Uncharacterized protein n=1 Tax=Cylindrobasidium torrendii FP15055 ss-10 TaxID=1314674 RepID=A0A0D7B1W0_9AGAR|nr:hypothetical protein CYLTODRAFT_135413 [Cylindrobasidium torrendii FP15055 ss-10]